MMLHRCRQGLRKYMADTALCSSRSCAELDSYGIHLLYSTEFSSRSRERSCNDNIAHGAKTGMIGHERDSSGNKTIEGLQESTSRTRRALRRGGDGAFFTEAPHLGVLSTDQTRRARRTRRVNDILPKLGIYEGYAEINPTGAYYLPIRAYHIARSIDVERLSLQEYFDRPHHQFKNCTIVPGKNETYTVVFNFGSVVFFNFSAKERAHHINLATKYSEFPSSIPCEESYVLVVNPELDLDDDEKDLSVGQDHLVLRRSDVNSIRVMATVLAQSVALDHVSQQVDQMLEVFASLNHSIKQNGWFKTPRSRLAKLVSTNNLTLTEIVTKLGLLDRSHGPAWRYSHFSEIWDEMRNEFELDERFRGIEFKISLVQDNVKYFLEVLQNQRSDFLEWIIIVLISTEICVSVYDIVNGKL